MFARTLDVPNYNFFLFGPRGTGKTTWLRERLPEALTFNLLLDQDYMPLLSAPHRLRERVESFDGRWIVIDEVQRLPTLLNEVHDLISRHGKRYRFAISGSSARKLRRMDVNLLAGRAIERSMYPLTARELGAEFDLARALAVGTVPDVYVEREFSEDILRAYTNTYLRQEIQQDALVKDIGSFHRMLRVAALTHGQPVNISNVARESSVARKTVERYFDILVDTLVGYRLPGWQPRAKVREHIKPKFYLFDSGVVRALLERGGEPLHDSERGPLLEGYLLHELRAALSYGNHGGELSYWRTSSGKEIDFIYQRGDYAVGVEVKASRTWRRDDAKVLNEFIDAGHLDAGYVVYLGTERFRAGRVNALPVSDFLTSLYDERFFPSQK